MGIVQNDGRGRLVQLTRLDADEAVLDVVDAADAVLAADVVELFDERHAVRLDAVERDGSALLELDLDVGGFVRRLARIGGPGKRLLGWLVPRIFENAG